MSEDRIFETASRLKLNFTSPRGELRVEQVWDLPLTSEVPNKPNINSLAVTVMTELNTSKETQFIDMTPDPQRQLNELRLAILKRIRDVKQAENAERTAAASRRSQIEMLQSILEEKKIDGLKSKTVEDLEAELASLRAKS
jgi:hypothetical protein